MEEENCRFQVETAPSQELMKEGYRVVIYRTWRSIVNIALAIVCLGAAAYQAYDALKRARLGWGDAWNNNIPYMIYFLVLAGFIIGRLIAAPGIGARKYMKRLAAVHGDAAALKVTYSFADDAIHSQSSTGQKVDTAYDQIISVRETAHGIVLARKLNLFEVLDKETLQGGSLEDFRTFLQEKMPNAKFSWKRRT